MVKNTLSLVRGWCLFMKSEVFVEYFKKYYPNTYYSLVEDFVNNDKRNRAQEKKWARTKK